MSIIVLLFLLALSSSSSSCVLTALAQANHTAASKGDSTGTTVSMLLVIFIFALCITACCSIYVRYCSYEPQLTIPQTVRVATRGLDPRVLATCPVVSYSSLKLKHFNLPQNASLQCTVCLAEFADLDVLRLLPRCGHVFHPACIDRWLAAHVTCPVCRGEVSVEIEGGACARYIFDESSVRGGEERVGDENVAKEKTFRVLLRSHSTGHSLEGFDVKLPEEVMKKIMEDSERGSVMTMKRSASYNVVFRSMEGGESSSSNSNNSKGKGNNFWVLSRTPPFVSRSSGIPKFWGVRDEKKWEERTVFHFEV